MKTRNFNLIRSHTVPVLIWEEEVAKRVRITRLSPRPTPVQRWLKPLGQPWPPRRFIMLRPKPM